MKSLYALLLHLFPRAYRGEFGDELQTVFNLSLDDAMSSGRLEFVWVTLRELSSLPKAILHEHLRERRKAHMIRKFGAFFDFTYGSNREFLMAIYPFFLLGCVSPIITMISLSGIMRFPNPLFDGIAIVLLVVMGILCLIGLGAGMPRWSLPYLGFALTILSVISFSALLDFRPLRLYDRLSPLGDRMFEGGWWFGLLVAMILLVTVTRTLPAFQRFRNDWTLLCFIPYGGVPFALMLTFDEYTGDESFMFFSFLVLASGTWLYLHNKHEWKRFGALFGAMTLAMFIAVAGKAILLPTQDWLFSIDSVSWKTEAMYTINTWIWLALIMSIPLMLNLLPRPKDRLQTADVLVS